MSAKSLLKWLANVLTTINLEPVTNQMSVRHTSEPTREKINQLSGSVMLEFGAEWCVYCKAAQGIVSFSLAIYPNVRYIKIEDGKDRALGRSFTVKLWPTLIFMKDGIELRRLAMHFNSKEIVSALNLID